ncbi:nuclear transport factor 2 family protein [Niallia sp. BSM11]|uniref:nuclear transport factor 2 family protein n=1 Tax=Niallia sp. BSM11 TaxID=3391576 RepID=UPI0039854AA8
MKVVSAKDCGNSPKKLFIQNHLIASAKKDIFELEATFAADIIWTIAGSDRICGKKEVLDSFNKNCTDNIVEVGIHHIITHGSTAAANGSYKTVNNSQISFCHVYSFVSAGKNIIKEMTTYLIRV